MLYAVHTTMNKTVVTHIDSITKVFNDAKVGFFINLPRLVMTLHYISTERFGAPVDFHEAQNGYSLFSIKATTFLLVYPPKNIDIKILCRHRDAYEWRAEFILGSKNVEEMMQFISDRVGQPPSPISP